MAARKGGVSFNRRSHKDYTQRYRSFLALPETGGCRHCCTHFVFHQFIMELELEPSKIWLLLVNYKFEVVGGRFWVRTSDDIYDLKKQVKEENLEALSRAHVDPDELTPWKTKGARINNESTHESLSEILGGIDVRDQDTIEELIEKASG